MKRVTKNGIMANTSTMFIPSWANKDNFCFAVTHWSTEYTLNIILSDASASKNAFLVVKVFEIVFRCRRNPPFVPRLIKVSLNSRQNRFTFYSRQKSFFQEKAFVRLSSAQKIAIFFLILGDENKAFLICTLRKSHFCGAPASRMKYSRVNLEYHHTL